MLSRALILNNVVVLRAFSIISIILTFLNNQTYPSSLDNPVNNRTYTAGILDYSGQ